jgi:glycerol-3-phosphate acyltransferase PlsY
LELLKIAGVIVISYLIGSILTGDIVASLKRVNIRAQGSGNVGATNVFRNMGAFYGALVLVGDALKGILAVLIANWVGKVNGFDPAVLAGICAIAGHNWSLFAKFKGGKGIATSLGVVIALTPMALVVLLPIWLGLFLITRYVSLASILAALVYPVSTYFFYPDDLFKLLFSSIIGVLAVYRHKSNIVRLIKGEEHKITFSKRKDATKK